MKFKQCIFVSLFLAASVSSQAQTTKFTLKTAKPVIGLYINSKNGSLPLDELPNPFIYELGIKKGDIIYFKSEIDTVKKVIDNPAGNLILQIIRIDKSDTLFCDFSLFQKPEKALFTKKYSKKFDGLTVVEIPEVYELMNVLFAITPTGKTNKSYVYKNTAYYKSVLQYFEKFSDELIVKKIDTLLKEGSYAHLKMEAYSFVFAKNNKIERSKVYNTTSWKDKNYLLPYLDLLNDFSIKTNFLHFYNTNRPFYNGQISVYRDSINISRMKKWLENNFPSTTFNCIKVILSPLVNGEQSSNSIENNNFKEVQAHVNYPYKGKSHATFSVNSSLLMRGDFVFTEINHGYLGPLSEKYVHEISQALKDLSKLNEKGRGAESYNSPTSCFDEYMNWGLVSLFYHDFAEKDELPKLLTDNENYMKRRGFIKFAEFNKFLTDLYHVKGQTQTIEDLYPQLIEWFSKN